MSRPDRLAGADLGETAAGAGAGTAAKAVLEAGLETVDTVTGFFREGEAGPAKEGEPTPGDEIEAGVAITSADGGKTEIPAAAPAGCWIGGLGSANCRDSETPETGRSSGMGFARASEMRS